MEQSRQKRDLWVIVFLAIVVYLVSGMLDFQESLERFCDRYERFELDEVMVVGLFLIPASMIYVRRRWQDLTGYNRRLEEAQDEIEHLRGILPICCVCKKIRDDEGYWHEVETYFKNHLDTSFTHGICDDCMKKTYPDLPVKKSEK